MPGPKGSPDLIEGQRRCALALPDKGWCLFGKAAYADFSAGARASSARSAIS